MMEDGQPAVIVSGGLLLALLPPLGGRSLGSQAWLKWAGPEPLVIGESYLSVPGEDSGRDVASAFALVRGTPIDAPASLALVEPRARRGPTRWSLNGLRVTAQSIEPERSLIVLWLPLLVPLPDDPHFIVAIVNSGPDPLSLPDLIFESRLRIGHADHPFADPGLWDGRTVVAAGAAAVLRLRFDHFGATVPYGSATMEFSCGAWSSDPVPVVWRQADA